MIELPPLTQAPVKMNIPAKPWKSAKPPRRILAIRLQAMGDLAAALPYLQDLRNNYPSPVKLDLLTRKEVDDIPRNLELFDKVISIGGGRNLKRQLLSIFFLLPGLLLRRYDIVLDLQNNILTEIVRKAIRPKAWTVFDRFSPVSGGERYRLTIEAAGVGKSKPANKFYIKNEHIADVILKKHGWKEGHELVVLNPAAAFPSRSWPIDNYLAFSRRWLNDFPATQFLVMGTSFIAQKAEIFQRYLGDKLINLVGLTKPSEAFAILQKVKLVLSEDSGLMHMAWVSGVPTLGLFGATRTDHVRPIGEHTYFLDSSDLPCGGCMQETCRYGDVHCLTRYSPEQVFDYAYALIKKVETLRENKNRQWAS